MSNQYAAFICGYELDDEGRLEAAGLMVAEDFYALEVHDMLVVINTLIDLFDNKKAEIIAKHAISNARH